MPLDLRDLLESAETVNKWRLQWVLEAVLEGMVEPLPRL